MGETAIKALNSLSRLSLKPKNHLEACMVICWPDVCEVQGSTQWAPLYQVQGDAMPR